jgi:hypothetical protein
MIGVEAIKQCSICTRSYTGWGNNAAPFEGRCCDDCNARFVLPARIDRMKAWDEAHAEK